MWHIFAKNWEDAMDDELLIKLRKFWQDMDECAERFDAKLASGEQKAPRLMASYRLGKLGLAKTFWLYTVLPMVLLSVAAYGTHESSPQVSSFLLLFVFGYGVLGSGALRYSASRHNGSKFWKRSTQLFTMLMMITCSLGVLSFITV